jgi:hypothetical protein
LLRVVVGQEEKYRVVTVLAVAVRVDIKQLQDFQ